MQVREPHRLVQVSPSKPGPCKLLRRGLFSQDTETGWVAGLLSATGIDLEAAWVQRHVAVCPRCQLRLARQGRVMLALSLLKAQPHNLTLLAQANAKALGQLGRALRAAPKAAALRTAVPNPSFLDTLHQFRGSVTQVAACVAVMMLARLSTFGALQSTQSKGQQAVRDYYDRHVGQDLADEVFPRS